MQITIANHRFDFSKRGKTKNHKKPNHIKQTQFNKYAHYENKIKQGVDNNGFGECDSIARLQVCLLTFN